MTDISVAMATYNGARFITEQLESLARQTLSPKEVVIADDCSTDGTLDVVAAYAAKAPFPIHAARNPKQLGYRDNFMAAASRCQSPIIAFCDQDDVWDPRKLELCGALFARKDVLFVYHNAMAVTEDLKPLGGMDFRGAPQKINPPLSLDPWIYGLGFTQLLRRELLAYADLWQQSLDFNGPQNREAHDQWFSFLGSCLGSTGYIAEPLVLYRRHTTTTTLWGSSAGFAAKFKNLMATKRGRLADYALSAQRRVAALEQIQGRLAGEESAQAKAAAVRWRKIAGNCRRRGEMYLASGLLPRLGKFMGLLKGGVYGPAAAGGVGHKELVRDFVRGVLFPAPAAP